MKEKKDTNVLIKITDDLYIDFETIRAVYSEDDGAYLVIQYKDSEHFLNINDKETQDLVLKKLHWYTNS